MLKAFFKVSRPLNVLIAILTSIVGVYYINPHIDVNIIPIIIIVGTIAVFANVSNDIIDYRIDLINKIDRPLPSSLISIKDLIYFCIVILFLSLFTIALSSIHINGKIFCIVIIYPSIILYNLVLKKLPLIGNIVTAMILGSVFLFSELAVLGTVDNIQVLFFLATLLSFPRELIKDIEDIKGDQQYKYNTFPIKFGIKNSQYVFYISAMMLVCYSIFVYNSYQKFDTEYLILVVILIHIPIIYCCLD